MLDIKEHNKKIKDLSKRAIAGTYPNVRVARARYWCWRHSDWSGIMGVNSRKHFWLRQSVGRWNYGCI